jgi:DNA-binding transcriptional MerR regulator
MNLDRNIFENADILAATGLSATTIQTWANRGILALSEKQRNPGVGQKRLYSGLDIARIAATKALIDRGLSTNAAGQIALRLERSPQTAKDWRGALEQSAPHVHVFVDGVDVVRIYVGHDAGELAQILTAVNEPSEGGFIGETTQIQMKASVFDIGSEVCNAVQKLPMRENERGARAAAQTELPAV